MPDADLRTGRIAFAAGAIAATVVVAVAGVLLWLHAHQLPPPRPMPRIPAPVLESAPQPAHRAAQAEQEQRLNGLGWVDAQAGIAHIPIEAAMALQAARASASASKGRP